jgi:hypothetical protein
MIGSSKILIVTVSPLLFLSPVNGAFYDAFNNNDDDLNDGSHFVASDVPFRQRHRILFKEKKGISQTVNDCDRLTVKGDEEDARRARELGLIRDSNSIHGALAADARRNGGTVYGEGDGGSINDIFGKKGSSNGAGYSGKKGYGYETQSVSGDDDDGDDDGDWTTALPPPGDDGGDDDDDDDDDDNGFDSATPEGDDNDTAEVIGKVDYHLLWRTSAYSAPLTFFHDVVSTG